MHLTVVDALWRSFSMSSMSIKTRRDVAIVRLSIVNAAKRPSEHWGEFSSTISVSLAYRKRESDHAMRSGPVLSSGSSEVAMTMQRSR